MKELNAEYTETQLRGEQEVVPVQIGKRNFRIFCKDMLLRNADKKILFQVWNTDVFFRCGCIRQNGEGTFPRIQIGERSGVVFDGG